MAAHLFDKGIQCAATEEGNADWALTNSLTLATGTCVPGYSGSPTRPCNADGSFGDIINPCTRTLGRSFVRFAQYQIRIQRLCARRASTARRRGHPRRPARITCPVRVILDGPARRRARAISLATGASCPAPAFVRFCKCPSTSSNDGL